ncbi:MAG: hypothetical protein JOY62_00955 [Acidobacteriaceae bacterium]|nr:hypothetical protein [Acidobacteriaceae bacterium]MBV9778515.1 hypothetical protein [Acidobacteriaceae bacterium]
MRRKYFQTAALMVLPACLAIAAQTASSGQATSPQSTGTQAQTQTADPNDVQFANNRTAPPAEAIPSTSETPTLWNGFETHFAVEFGGRALSNSGNADVYATFVNLQSGVRLLDQSLDLHSVDHNRSFFDDLTESSFGLGGDPNQTVRLRASKHHWYDFDGVWRKDLNFWDYNLLGNPLNPPSSTPFIPVNVSPHLLDISRRMLDLDLRLFPESKVQLVLGYSHYDNGGPSFTTVHVGTEAELFQHWRDIADSYHFGLSWLPVERTRFTYDQFYTHEKSDTNDFLNSFPYLLPNGAPVNLGITFNTLGGSPCATPFLGPFANPACDLFLGYSNTAPYSTDIPTEQIGFQTSYFPRLHITGRASYTGAQTHVPSFQELFNGIDSFFGVRLSSQTGSGSAEMITTSVDAGVTYDVTEKLSIDDQFRWYYYRIPSGASYLQNYFFAPTALSPINTFPSPACPPPYIAPGCPQHNFISPADVSTVLYAFHQSQNQKRNTFEAHYNFSPKVTAYAGYKFEKQDIVFAFSDANLSLYFPTLAIRGGCTPPLPPNGVCAVPFSESFFTPVPINTQGGLIGVAAQPVHGLRLNADIEADYSDNIFTNIMPRHMQLYRAKAIYNPKNWINMSASMSIRNARNLDSGLGNLQHNRGFSLATVLTPSSRWGVDVNYTYTDFSTNLTVCFVETPAPSFATVTPLCTPAYLQAVSFYHNIDNFGSVNLMVKPIARTTLTLGYAITSTTGTNLLLNPNAPLGPAEINYHLPNAALAIDVAKRVTFKAGWNYYDYQEKSPPGPFAPRDFRASLFTVSLRYAM